MLFTANPRMRFELEVLSDDHLLFDCLFIEICETESSFLLLPRGTVHLSTDNYLVCAVTKP